MSGRLAWFLGFFYDEANGHYEEDLILIANGNREFRTISIEYDSSNGRRDMVGFLPRVFNLGKSGSVIIHGRSRSRHERRNRSASECRIQVKIERIEVS
jgi:hypothetical protein